MKRSADVADRLRAYVDLLRPGNPPNTRAATPPAPHLEQRHVEDSLQLLPLIPDDVASAVDLGSGAGFPGLVLSIASGIRFTLIESDQRKAAFLREAIRETQAPAEVRAVRMETLDLQTPLVTVRAVASVAALMPVLARLVSPGGCALLPKGETAGAELTAVPPEWQMRVERHPSRTRPGATILKLSDIARRHA